MSRSIVKAETFKPTNRLIFVEALNFVCVTEIFFFKKLPDDKSLIVFVKVG